jgi:hypothetical protein
VKLLRLLRGSRALAKLQQMLSISYAVQDLCKLVVLTTFVCHLLACGFGMVAYLDTSNRESGWVSKLVQSDRISQEEACMDDYVDCPPGSAAVQTGLYTYAFYWAMATCTTIGYGDIVPSTVQETSISTVMMLFAGFFWAWVLGTSCSIASALAQASTQFKRHVDSTNRLISDCRISGELATDLRKYVYSAEKVIQSRQHHLGVINSLSPELQGRVIFEWFGDWVLRVPYVARGSPGFVVEVARNLMLQMYARGEAISQIRAMFALEKGTAWSKLRRIGEGHVWGTDMILSSPELRHDVTAICISLVELRFLDYKKFSEILDEYPTEKPRVRKYVVKLTVLRGSIAYAKKVLEVESELYKFQAEKSEPSEIRCGGSIPVSDPQVVICV